MRRSLGSSGWEARISIAKRAPSGGWPSQVTSGPRAVSPSSTPGPRRSMPRTKTCAAAIASVPIFALRPTTSGRSGMTGPSAFPTRVPFPPAIVAHALHYYTLPDALVVDPMAGGGTTLDVCQSMGRRCLAYDLHPARPEIRPHDIRHGFPAEAAGCDLIFCDPPYHTMLARQYSPRRYRRRSLLRTGSPSSTTSPATPSRPFGPGGYLALLLAAQTEKDLRRLRLPRSRLFWPISAASVLAFSPSGGSVARWTAPIFPSMSAAPDAMVACSGRFATSWSCANHPIIREYDRDEILFMQELLIAI